MLWNAQTCDESLAESFSRELGVAPVVGRLLAQRGLASLEEAEIFLRPSLAHLRDPFELTNMRPAVDRINAAVDGGEDIVVFGDYDVDGVTSTVQLISLLRMLGADPRFCVPRRLDEGYGLSREAIDRALDGRVPGLFVALDCGTNAHDSIAYLNSLGTDVIVIDHHQSKVSVPHGCTFINPHVNDPPDAPWADMCAAGLVFKLLHGLLKRRREADDPRVRSVRLRDYLDLVSLGTIADLVPLTGENRILSWYGLRHLRANGREGVRALAEVSGLDAGRELVSADVSFKLGPRINASGRLADACLPIELLLSDDPEACRRIARELDRMNRERQGIERAIVEEAERRAEEAFAGDPGVVLFGQDWHPGVVGIVASRISRRLHKPAVVLGYEDGQAKGSGRSVPGVDLVAVFQRCSHLLDHWGGHPMAAGISLNAARVDAFREAFVDALADLYPGGPPRRSLVLGDWIKPGELDVPLLEQLDQLHPFGQGNEEPVFGLRGVRLGEEPEAFGKGHFRFRLPAANACSSSLSAIAWNTATPPPAHAPVDLAVRFAWNHWRGSRTPQLTLVDWRKAE